MRKNVIDKKGQNEENNSSQEKGYYSSYHHFSPKAKTPPLYVRSEVLLFTLQLLSYFPIHPSPVSVWRKTLPP